MGIVADRFKAAWRDYKTDGVPASGPHDPRKDDIRAAGEGVEIAIAAAVLGEPTAEAEALLESKVQEASAQADRAELAAEMIGEIVIGGRYPTPAGVGAAGVPGATYYPNEPLVAGAFRTIEIRLAKATLVIFGLAQRFGTEFSGLPGTLTVELPSGMSRITYWAPPITGADKYLSITPVENDALLYDNNGPGFWYAVGGGAATLAANFALCVGWEIGTGARGDIAQASSGVNRINREIDAPTATAGSIVDTDAYISSGFTTYAEGMLLPMGQVLIVDVDVEQDSAGILVLSRIVDGSTPSDPPEVATVAATLSVTLKAGVNTYAWQLPNDLDALEVRVGLTVADGGVGFYPATGKVLLYHGGSPVPGSQITRLGNQTSSFRWTALAGLSAKLDFAVSAAVKTGGSEPPVPEPEAPDFNRLYSVMAQAIGTNSPLVVIGDSLIAHFAAPTLADTVVSQLTAGLNADAAPGMQPTRSVFFDNNEIGETAAFYGLAVVGGTEIDAGPLGKALRLANNGYLEFTGGYTTVEAFVNQQSGGGTLVRTRNGSTSGTSQPTTGSGLDVLTSFGAANPASATWRFTATGGPVDITNIPAFPAFSTSPRKRPVRVMRQAYGGYTTAQFTDARIDSIGRQATAFGPRPEYLLEPMTNDMLFGPPSGRPAAFEAGLVRIISRLRTSWGASRIGLMITSIPGVEYFQYFKAGEDFQTYAAIVRKVARANDCYVIGLDHIDFGAMGLFASDKLHWNLLAQNVVTAETVRQRIAAG